MRENANEHKSIRHLETQNKKGKRCTAEGLRGEKKPGLITVDVRLSYHNWKLAACVESLKSIPMETVTEASGSSRSVNGKEGGKGKSE